MIRWTTQAVLAVAADWAWVPPGSRTVQPVYGEERCYRLGLGATAS